MESQCDYFMYFPSAPISSLTNLAEYITLPRRHHVYLGETVQFLFVLRSRKAVERDDGTSVPPWKDLVGSLSAQASVCVAECREQRPSEYQQDPQSSCSEDGGEELPGEREDGTTDIPGRRPDSNRTFRQSSALLIHNSASDRRQYGSETVKVRRKYEYFRNLM